MTARSIHDDDPDALARLRDKLRDLEAQRDRVTRYNATTRKGKTPDLSILSQSQRDYLATCLAHTPYNCPNRRMPTYVSGNLSNRITQIRQRIARLEKAALLG